MPQTDLSVLAQVANSRDDWGERKGTLGQLRRVEGRRYKTETGAPSSSVSDCSARSA